MDAKTIDEFIAALPAAQAEIVSNLRAMVRAAAPDAVESLESDRIVYNEHGPIVYIRPHHDHVDYGLWRGAEMPDPEYLLQGDGPEKHAKFASLEEYKKKELAYKYFVKIAVRLNHEKGDPTK
jgi:hypothetical protein